MGADRVPFVAMPIFKSASIRSPAPPDPENLDRLGLVQYYIDFYRQDYTQVREANKARAKAVVFGTSALNASVAVIGALTTWSGWTWLGILSAAVGGIGLIIASYEGLIQNRELWIKRTPTVHRLNELDRRYRFLAISATLDERDRLAAQALDELNECLDAAFQGWSSFRQNSAGRMDENAADESS